MVRQRAGHKVWQGHQRILIDTCVWIYHIEGHEEFGLVAGKVIAAVESGACQGISSDLSLMELMVRPLQLKQQGVADEYELLLTSFPNLLLAPVTRNVLSLAATLRARYGLRTPDAIVLATGIRNGATLAITNDVQWQRASAEISVHLISEA